MNILILGGSGFVSGHAARAALAAGHNVWCLTRGGRKSIPGTVAITADRNDRGEMRRALAAMNMRWDAVLDCICFNAEQARADIAVFGEFTGRIIVISTDSLYSPVGKRVPQDETGVNYMQGSSYGAQKREMELVFLKECPETLRWTIFRPPHMYGEGSLLGCFPFHTRQRDFIEYVKNGGHIRLAGSGTYKIQPLYAGDLAAAMTASIDRPECFNEIFCIAGPDVISNKEYFEIACGLLGLEPVFDFCTEEEYSGSHDDAYLYFLDRVYDLGKLRRAGLPMPSVGVREGLRRQIGALQGE